MRSGARSPAPAISCRHDPPALAQGPARRAALPPRRRGDAGDHVGDRPQPGDPAPDEGLLGVPGHDHGLQPARALVRRVPGPVPLDGADPVVADRDRALGLRGGRRGLPQEQRHHDGAPLQPDEAEPRRRAGPRPHHRGGDARDGPGGPRVPDQAGPDPLPGPRLPVPAERDHRREGDQRARPGHRRHRHRRARVVRLPGEGLPAALPARAAPPPGDHRPHRRVRARRGDRRGHRGAGARPDRPRRQGRLRPADDGA